MAQFVGREHDLNRLDQLWSETGSNLFIVTGRRRVGKTRLLTHWLETNPNRGFYWMAEKTSTTSQIRSFSKALHRFMNPSIEPGADFTYGSWEMALGTLAAIGRDSKTCVFIDEVVYLHDADPDFFAYLQKAWDGPIKNSNVMLGMSGSQREIIENNFVNMAAPMYGRAREHIVLDPLSFRDTETFFPMYTKKERLQLYAIWGGIPEYWERVDTNRSIPDNIEHVLLPRHSWWSDEARILLQDYVTDESLFVAVMRALAENKTTNKQIAEHAGVVKTSVPFYLNKLRTSLFIQREIPVSKVNVANTRAGRYVIKDNFLMFFYRFIAPNKTILQIRRLAEVLDTILEGLDSDSFFGITWKELCKEWLLIESLRNGIGPIEIGEQWDSKGEMNLVGISQKAAIFGQAWVGNPGIKEIDDWLKYFNHMKIPAEMLKGKDAYIYLCSVDGWSDEAISYRDEVFEKLINSNKEDIQFREIRFVSLDDIDLD